jgi:subtilisin family serine protease
VLFSRGWPGAALFLAGVALIGASLSVLPPKHADSARPGGPVAADSLIVKFNSNASEQAIAALNDSNATTQVDAIPALGLRVLRLPPGASAEKVLAAYARNPLVEFAEPNVLVAPDVVPNDPYYGNAWHLPKIEAPAAWDMARANGVLIAICDTGVEATHPDLAPILRGDLGWNAASNNSDWSPIQGHGTLVAGAAAAATNNATGVSGVAWGAQIIPVRISNNTDGTAYVSDAVKCIQSSADRGARVINLSYRMAGYSAIDTAASYARQRGALTFVAAGNDGIDPNWPDFPNFLAVAATTDLDARPSWSNFGGYVDIAAPGISVRTTRIGASYTWASGTSLASPVAAGVAALVLGTNPALGPSQVEQILRESADDVAAGGEDDESGSGRVNARRAVALAGGSSLPPSPTPTPTATPISTATPVPTNTPAPSPTATPTPDNPDPSPTATPTATSTPAPTNTPAPTATTAPKNLVTDTFTGKVGGKNQPPSRSHSVTLRSDGPMTVSLSWGGKAKLQYTVYSSAGQAVQSGTTSGAATTVATLPAGTYTVVVTTNSGQATYTLTATHY